MTKKVEHRRCKRRVQFYDSWSMCLRWAKEPTDFCYQHQKPKLTLESLVARMRKEIKACTDVGGYGDPCVVCRAYQKMIGDRK